MPCSHFDTSLEFTDSSLGIGAVFLLVYETTDPGGEAEERKIVAIYENKHPFEPQINNAFNLIDEWPVDYFDLNVHRDERFPCEVCIKAKTTIVGAPCVEALHYNTTTGKYQTSAPPTGEGYLVYDSNDFTETYKMEGFQIQSDPVTPVGVIVNAYRFWNERFAEMRITKIPTTLTNPASWTARAAGEVNSNGSIFYLEGGNTVELESTASERGPTFSACRFANLDGSGDPTLCGASDEFRWAGQMVISISSKLNTGDPSHIHSALYSASRDGSTVDPTEPILMRLEVSCVTARSGPNLFPDSDLVFPDQFYLIPTA